MFFDIMGDLSWPKFRERFYYYSRYYSRGYSPKLCRDILFRPKMVPLGCSLSLGHYSASYSDLFSSKLSICISIFSSVASLLSEKSSLASLEPDSSMEANSDREGCASLFFW
jgi:hypothetical protein